MESNRSVLEVLGFLELWISSAAPVVCLSTGCVSPTPTKFGVPCATLPISPPLILLPANSVPNSPINNSEMWRYSTLSSELTVC